MGRFRSSSLISQALADSPAALLLSLIHIYLTYTVQLSSDEYGVGFRKGSDLAEAFSSFWKEAYDAGTVMEIAEKYGIQDVMIEK